MNTATSKLNGYIYSTLELSQIISEKLDNLKQNLIFTEFNQPLFFRQASLDGRAACFGARPYADDCSPAAQDYFKTEDRASDIKRSNHMPGSKTIVDFRYGASARS